MVTTERSTRIVQVGAERRDAWDAMVASERSFALLQSWDWGSFKERTGWRAVRLGAERGGDLVAGAQILLRRLGPVSAAYVPRGPVGTWLDDDVAAPLLDAVRRAAWARRAMVLRIEPSAIDGDAVRATLREQGFRVARSMNQPRATIVVDMADGSDRALERMHHKARYNIRRAERQGMVIRTGDVGDLPAFHRMMRTTGERAGFRVRDLAYYRAQWETFAPTGSLRLFIASHEGHDLAMNVSATFGDVGAYLHGASADVRRALNPNEYLMWEAMRWAESRGCAAFDLWGVPDEVGEAAAAGREIAAPDRRDGLWGVYGFKRRIGRRVELYAPAHDLLRPAALGSMMGRFR